MLTRRAFLRNVTLSSLCISATKAIQPGLEYLSRVKAHYDFVKGEPEIMRNSWTLAVLPDTQYYTAEHQKYFIDQVKWIAANRKKFNIQFVTHVGDVTDENTRREWNFARKAFSVLDTAKIPYGFCIGNHDMSDRGWCFDRSTLGHKYFPSRHWQKMVTFRGAHNKNRITNNSYHFLDTKYQKYLVLFLEFGPRDKILDWANKLVLRYSNRKVIVVTHTYLTNDNSRINKSPSNHLYTPQNYAVAKFAGGVNDGEQMWQKFISQHKNIQLVLCGHINPFAYLESMGKNQNKVHQMMVDYQDWDKGGEGWMRLLQFSNNNQKLFVQDFSPSTKQINKFRGARYTVNL